MDNILVVYWHNMPQMRTTTYDHLYCFARYLPQRVYYVNLADAVLPWYVRAVDFDLIIFHDLFFCGRWGGRELFAELCRKVDFLRSSPALKIAVPQDEFIAADQLCAFINNFAVAAVFSVTPASEWPKVYRDVDRDKVRFYEVLTGYLEERTLARIAALVAENPARTAAIGYRAGGRNWRQSAWLGRHGILKITLADAVAAAAARFGIVTDISTRREDVFMGDDWYRFLARCKYTIGLEGGASLLDWDGTVHARTMAYVDAHPEATLEAIEQACFPGLDGKLALFALSPRHLEACATHTCQILIEGAYNGVLEAGRHYIPLKRDFSNLDAVMQQVQRDDARAGLTAAAYADIVASGRYTYRAFADFIMAEAGKLRSAPARSRQTWRANWHFARYRLERRLRLDVLRRVWGQLCGHATGVARGVRRRLGNLRRILTRRALS
ncbi:MAG: hypothetical protein WBK91_05625 [Alphaproteobacteria bacterium]